MIHGVINVYKEKGYTSHDVVAKLRGIAGQKKIGHTGTLDPDATGVLPVCFGKATKLCDMLTDKDKVYETVLLLGTVTDTQDITGRVLQEQNAAGISEETVKNCIYQYIGSYQQLPPMYSALKVNGKKLYELAREGKEIERKTREVLIHRIEIKEMALPRVRMEVACSKGTYIRTLCHDIGQSLGVGGCMESLVRTKVSSFHISKSETLSQIEQRRDNNTLEEIIIPIDQMFLDAKYVTIIKKYAPLAYNGNPFKKEHCLNAGRYVDGEEVRVYDEENRFIAMYRYSYRDGGFKIVKMFLDEQEIRG